MDLYLLQSVHTQKQTLYIAELKSTFREILHAVEFHYPSLPH